MSPFDEHCRLGYPKFYPQFYNITSLYCELYRFSKHRQSSTNPRVNKRVDSTFELVHSDVEDQCPIVFKTVHKYLVTFVEISLDYLGFIL